MPGLVIRHISSICDAAYQNKRGRVDGLEVANPASTIQACSCTTGGSILTSCHKYSVLMKNEREKIGHFHVDAEGCIFTNVEPLLAPLDACKGRCMLFCVF